MNRSLPRICLIKLLGLAQTRGARHPQKRTAHQSYPRIIPRPNTSPNQELLYAPIRCGTALSATGKPRLGAAWFLPCRQSRGDGSSPTRGKPPVSVAG